MSKDKLVIVNNDYVYRIQWEVHDDDFDDVDLGAILGEDNPLKYTDEGLKTCDPIEWENYKANLIAKKTKNVERDSHGFYWESLSDANATLKVIKLALKDKSDKPLEDWEIKALAAGWKPPNNKK